jgi:putative RNA 2'-phosphotransferase
MQIAGCKKIAAMNKQHTKISKFLSLILRHRPEAIGIELDAQGWVGIDELLRACAANGRPLSRADLEYVVTHNNKKRFAISEDGRRIRASQGHSIEVELGYEAAVPPDTLYHGTAVRNLDSIRQKGLLKGQRHHVHLSLDEATARNVGQRHGTAVVLTVRVGDMVDAGFTFFVSANSVWLTDHVPATFIEGLGS